MQMQRELLSSLGISYLDCTSVKAASATRNYIFFLRRVSSSGSLVEMVSAMSPCPWSYLEIAEKLCERKSRIKTEEVYRRWIDFYASKESRRQVGELKTILGTRYLKANRKARRLMKINFGSACRYEYRFWEMSYHRQMV
jgi:thiaminase/transcriptional activator TenA